MTRETTKAEQVVDYLVDVTMNQARTEHERINAATALTDFIKASPEARRYLEGEYDGHK